MKKKAIKPKKDSLSKINTALERENASLKREMEIMKETDVSRRTVLSEMLDSYEYTSAYGMSRQEKSVKVRNWMGIAFLIGELKADANYAMVIEARDRLKESNQRLMEENYQLKQAAEKGE